MDILDFLNGNGIIVGEENFPKKDKKKYIWDTESQISLIIEVQRILRGKKINMIPRIESSIGREMESFIVQAKRISRMIKYFEEKYNKSDFDLFIVEEGNKILNRANKSLNALNEDEYLKIIMRSMNNYDICLGRVDEGNLKKEGLAIKIRTTRYISYNMIEQDCYNYIKRLKKRGYKEDINKLINDFVYKSNLNRDSIDYIRILSNYPIESIKVLLKLKEDRERFSDEGWVNQIHVAQNIDGIELL
ncbi:hypothetical protein [Clostridium sp.]|uniref:hypothetical protein n=2 Tax=Clostridium TaxID=1485 RepID=UPI0025C6AD68|nr:hypothetical protein [Clostridium sp.]MCI9070078.1 hypothetical protein [Clostridium sp.]MCI9303694.1 hypothetical protein [Clostridium sp.]